jgi:hypothetical protein
MPQIDYEELTRQAAVMGPCATAEEAFAAAEQLSQAAIAAGSKRPDAPDEHELPELGTAGSDRQTAVMLTSDEITAVIDIFVWANPKSGGRRIQGAVGSAWNKLIRSLLAKHGYDPDLPPGSPPKSPGRSDGLRERIRDHVCELEGIPLCGTEMP